MAVINGWLDSPRHGQKGQWAAYLTGRRAWHDACSTKGVKGLRTYSATYGHGSAIATAADESHADQPRRRAAHWHARLNNPECTLQDRENFERWCADPVNAVAYVAVCGGLAWTPDT